MLINFTDFLLILSVTHLGEALSGKKLTLSNPENYLFFPLESKLSQKMRIISNAT